MPKQKGKTSKILDSQGKEVIFNCPKCNIPMQRGKEKFDKDNFGVAKLTCKKCGNVLYDFMIPKESFFEQGEAE
ncbi:MAG: hypothetical protein PHD95_00320 [Candidatus ainarchaeum sp.]|nr:hypothetical protein [Candidatus ainarchaeum sp.]